VASYVWKRDRMRALRQIVGLAAAIGVVALPAVATARPQHVVPPGNSAVIQYTETFPTAGGDARPHHRADRSPADVLGPRKAHKLASEGTDGQAVAVVAAETAPPSVVAPTGKPKAAVGRPVPPGTGESGIARVIAEATGSSDSGKMGLLLPLLIVCALLGSTAYALRHKRRAP
jgi:hypothetical protein